jgi:hypothetical protein
MYINFDNPNWPIQFLTQMVGCTQNGPNNTVDPEQGREIAMFVDPNNANNWHAMLQQQNGSWASKNGEAPPVFNITDPVAYYDQLFSPTDPGQVQATYWSCPIPLD